jgi:hypothetical protein
VPLPSVPPQRVVGLTPLRSILLHTTLQLWNNYDMVST